MKTPEDYERELSAYLDGELDENATAAIARALEEQPALRKRLAALRGADEALARLPESAPSDALLVRLKAEMARDEASRVARPRTFRRAFVGAAFAAAAGLAAVVLWPEVSVEPQPPRAVVELEQEFGPLLQTPEGAPSPALAVENGDADGDLAVIEVLEFLEDLGDLSEAGRG